MQTNKSVKPNVYMSGLRLFFNLAERWELTAKQQANIIGAPDIQTIELWRQKLESNQPTELTDETIDALSLIASIRKSVELLYPKKHWDEYMNSSNRYFDNLTPLNVMEQQGLKGLYRVKEYLEAARGSHYQ